MKKITLKILLKKEKDLTIKIMELKQELKYQKKLNEELKKQNHDLIDEMIIKQMKIRELSLEK